MKNFAIISLAVCPLVAGCASLGTEQRSVSDRNEARITNVRSEVNTLRRRVRSLRKLVARRAAPVSAVNGEVRAELAELRRRVSLMATHSHRGQPSSDTASSAPILVDMEQSIAALTDRIEKLEAGGSSSAASHGNRSDNSQALAGQIRVLDARLKELAAAQRKLSIAKPGGAGTDAERLAKLEAAQKAAAERFEKLQAELEKDRTILIDFLEDLDKRIGALEPTQQPAQPKKP